MIITTNTFTHSELGILQSHIGSSLDSIAGNGLPDFLTSTEILIVTTDGVLHLWCDSVEYEFQAFSEDFSTWRIDEVPSGLAEATSHGDRYFFHKGEEVLNVEVVRETTREIQFGEPRWEYTTDVAVVLTLSGGKLVVERTDLNIEILTARFVEEGDDFELTPSDSYWKDTVDTRYENERVTRTVQALLREPS